jgi:hypothetical protein
MIHLSLIIFLRKPTTKRLASLHQKDVNANNANVAALVSRLSPLTISSSGKNKGTKPSAPACASHNRQALYTLYNGIPLNMTHALYYKLAMGLNSVVALNHKNPHTLPPNIFFVRVDGSMIPDKKSQCNKFVLGIQVTKPDMIVTTLARLMVDHCGIVVKIAAPDKFVHEQRIGIGETLGSHGKQRAGNYKLHFITDCCPYQCCC